MIQIISSSQGWLKHKATLSVLLEFDNVLRLDSDILKSCITTLKFQSQTNEIAQFLKDNAKVLPNEVVAITEPVDEVEKPSHQESLLEEPMEIIEPPKRTKNRPSRNTDIAKSSESLESLEDYPPPSVELIEHTFQLPTSPAKKKPSQSNAHAPTVNPPSPLIDKTWALSKKPKPSQPSSRTPSSE